MINNTKYTMTDKDDIKEQSYQNYITQKADIQREINEQQRNKDMIKIFKSMLEQTFKEYGFTKQK